ncbi:MAG: inorganic phosphate transporter [Planctomycetes bacterium]|nr:inorganic phosphate transporter [Planctomycetota bacterium]
MPLALLLAAVLFVAFANGANDNSKGIATLIGTGTLDERRAFRLGHLATLLGSLAAGLLATGLVARFSGQGLVATDVVADPAFLAAVGLGAAATVLLATRIGAPVSTTHALVGGLVGAGLVLSPAGVDVGALREGFVLPLLASPLAALLLAALLYPAFRSLRLALGISRETCLCLGREVRVVAVEGAALAVLPGPPALAAGAAPRCYERYAGRVVGLHAQGVLDALHVVSAASVSFARGLNDTPKIAALALAAGAVGASGVAVVAVAMAAGGILGARRVADTMGRRVTAMSHGQGASANLVTAFLVIVASQLGFPVSTTHVSCGALFGIGMVGGGARWRTVGGIVLAWVLTLPLAAVLGAGAAALLRSGA